MKKIFLMALVLCSLQNPLFANETLRPKTDKLAKDFTLLDLENKEASLSSFKGKSVVLFFWTTWCPFCRQELKELNKRHADFAKDGIGLLAIDIGESPDKVNNFLKNHSLDFRVLLDKDTAVAESYEIVGVPTYILIDKRGYIVFENHYFPQEYKDLISK